jgi:tyrosinase
MYQVISNPDFLSYASWLEGLPHGWPHMNIGWTMSMMNSPDDPVFFLHHCNIDRFFLLYGKIVGIMN